MYRIKSNPRDGRLHKGLDWSTFFWCNEENCQVLLNLLYFIQPGFYQFWNFCRESSAEKCYSMFYYPPAVIDKDIFAIMDSTLDENFTSLNVCIPFPALESFSSLMAIITKRCPKLESLKVIFRHGLGETSALDNRNEEREPSPYTIPPGSSLSVLKSLFLNFYDPRGLPRHDVLKLTNLFWASLGSSVRSLQS